VDGSGALDPAEFAVVAARLGYGALGPAELSLFMACFDADGDGQVDCEEFVAFLAPPGADEEKEEEEGGALPPGLSALEAALIKQFLLMTVFAVTAEGWRRQLDREEVRAAFAAADDDGSGSLSGPEFAAVVDVLGFKACTAHELQMLVSVFDDDGDGEIDIGEFEEFYFGPKERVWRALGVAPPAASLSPEQEAARAAGAEPAAPRRSPKARAKQLQLQYAVLELVRFARGYAELREALLGFYAKHDKSMLPEVDAAVLRYYKDKLV